jgi:DNA-binding transcriptional regulator YiaG
MTKQYQSEQLMVCHKDAEAMRRLGIISDAEMREFDEDCLVPDPKTPEKTPSGIQQVPASAYASPRKV